MSLNNKSDLDGKHPIHVPQGILTSQAVQSGCNEGIAGNGEANQGAQHTQDENVEEQKHKLLCGALRSFQCCACLDRVRIVYLNLADQWSFLGLTFIELPNPTK